MASGRMPQLGEILNSDKMSVAPPGSGVGISVGAALSQYIAVQASRPGAIVAQIFVFHFDEVGFSTSVITKTMASVPPCPLPIRVSSYPQSMVSPFISITAFTIPAEVAEPAPVRWN